MYIGGTQVETWIHNEEITRSKRCMPESNYVKVASGGVP